MPSDGSLHIANARVRRCLVDGERPGGRPSGGPEPADHAVPPSQRAGEGEQMLVDLVIEDGRIAALHPAGQVAPAPGAKVIDQDGGEVWPCPIDLHTHLDKGHVWPRTENPHGTFDGAMAADAADKYHWTASRRW